MKYFIFLVYETIADNVLWEETISNSDADK